MGRQGIMAGTLGLLLGGFGGYQLGSPTVDRQEVFEEGKIQGIELGKEEGFLEGFMMRNDIWRFGQGHKLGSGNKPSYRFRQASTLEERNKNQLNTECYSIKNNSIQVIYDFNISLKADLVATEGEGSAAFKIFKGNDLITPSSIQIEIKSSSPPRTVQEKQVEIATTDYVSVEGEDNMAVNFTVTVQIAVSNNDTADAFAIVGELLDVEGLTHLNNIDTSSGLESVTCDMSNNTLQYYKCIKAGNSHHRDHIIMEDIHICRE